MGMTSIQTEIPDQLDQMANILVQDGWYRSKEDIFIEAIRRFLDSHQATLMQKYIIDDVEWGLHGDD